jgi:hypothetical protein
MTEETHLIMGSTYHIEDVLPTDNNVNLKNIHGIADFRLSQWLIVDVNSGGILYLRNTGIIAHSHKYKNPKQN